MSSYVKIIGEDTKYTEEISTFTSQHGFDAVRFIGDPIPETDKGFIFYADNDEVITDLSAYKHIYRQNEYTVEKDIIVPPGPNNEPLPPSSFDRLSSRVSQVSNQVNAITPYEETKKAYYGEIEKVFYGVPKGNTTVFFDNFNGEYEVSRIEDRLTVKFAERLKDMTNVTIMVNK